MQKPRSAERRPFAGVGSRQLLSDLDLHHPPCAELVANEMFYAVATLAFNLLMALRVLELSDHAQGWRVRTIIRHLLTVPVSVSRHAWYVRAWLPKRRSRGVLTFKAKHAPSPASPRAFAKVLGFLVLCLKLLLAFAPTA